MPEIIVELLKLSVQCKCETNITVCQQVKQKIAVVMIFKIVGRLKAKRIHS